jgi:tRNA nucleotidyltransferase (CCA-adding enzyme)
MAIVTTIAARVKERGGRALLVGGCVRDEILGVPSKDVDMEVYGLNVDELKTVLSEFGTVNTVGASFGVFLINEVPGLDISVPRRDNRVGAGHRDFAVSMDPNMSIEDAARRRDFTMNSMAKDPLTGEVFDPFGGREDLKKKILKMTDEELFCQDQLRALRAIQFCARFDLCIDHATAYAVTKMRLDHLAGERLFVEFEKLLNSPKPSIGFKMMNALGLLRSFPELLAIVGVQQEKEWHPEGSVDRHTWMAVDEAVALRTGDKEKDQILMWATLCHDLGKATATEFVDGRWRSRGHESEGGIPTRSFFARFGGVPQTLVEQVVVIVENHLAPALYPDQGSGAGAYRRLARKLNAVGLTVRDLHRVSTADHFGRTTAEAIARQFPMGDEFLVKADAAGAGGPVYQDVVLGRHLLEIGVPPGKGMGEMLKRCREAQLEYGLTNVEEILEKIKEPTC